MNLLNKLKFFFTDYLRGYAMGDPKRNGEDLFLKKIIKKSSIIFDVGANVGEFSQLAIMLNPDATVHAFEPVSSTFDTLQKNLNFLSKHHVILNNIGLSNNAGSAKINIYGENAGSNSLFEIEFAEKGNPGFKTEIIVLDTIDNYVSKMGIKNIDFLKIDVEGNEVNVLLGSVISLNSGIVKCIQFEYGGSYIHSKQKLKYIFELLGNRFKFYRLTPWGKIKIPFYKDSLENYKHSNWVALFDE